MLCVPVRSQQQPAPAPPPNATISAAKPAQRWIQAAVGNQIRIVGAKGNLPLRYSVHKVDAKGDVIREVIETLDGSVARMVQKNGQPLSASEDAAERDRLKAILDSPDELAKRRKRDESLRDYVAGLIRLMPQAMIYSYTPGQPQPGVETRKQIVIDFVSDPAFHPPTIMADFLTGLSGRVWIDGQTERLTRIEAHVIRPVNFGWGVLARVYPGGTIEFEQENVSGSSYIYSRVNEHLKIREMMLKTEEQDTEMHAYNFHVLPGPVSLQNAVATLLSMQIPLR